MAQIKFYLGGNVVLSERMTKERAESLCKAINNQTPFLMKSNGYSATVINV